MELPFAPFRIPLIGTAYPIFGTMGTESRAGRAVQGARSLPHRTCRLRSRICSATVPSALCLDHVVDRPRAPQPADAERSAPKRLSSWCCPAQHSEGVLAALACHARHRDARPMWATLSQQFPSARVVGGHQEDDSQILESWRRPPDSRTIPRMCPGQITLRPRRRLFARGTHRERPTSSERSRHELLVEMTRCVQGGNHTPTRGATPEWVGRDRRSPVRSGQG